MDGEVSVGPQKFSSQPDTESYILVGKSVELLPSQNKSTMMQSPLQLSILVGKSLELRELA